jgi:hypothetical protein
MENRLEGNKKQEDGSSLTTGKNINTMLEISTTKN